MTRPRRISLFRDIGLFMLLLILLVPAFASAQEDTKPRTTREDSLKAEIENRLKRLGVIRDSLSNSDEEALGEALSGLTDMISGIGAELEGLDISTGDEGISFSTPEGDIRISVPEDLGTRIGEGLASITSAILAEIPDTLDLTKEFEKFKDASGTWSWDGMPPDAPKKEKRIVSSDVFTVDDDIVIAEDERVTGNVVVLFGDITILGQVDGEVVCIGGTLILGESALVYENAISFLGSMRRDESATIDGKVIAIGSQGLSGDLAIKPLLYGGPGVVTRLIGLLVLGLLAVMLIKLMPRNRIALISATLSSKPGRSFFLGAAWILFGHLLLIVVLAVLIVTIIGIPLALLLGLGYGVFWILALGLAAGKIGGRFFTRTTEDPGLYPPSIMTGLFIISVPCFVASALGNPSSDFLLLSRLFEVVCLTCHVTAYCFGAGALLASRFGSSNS
jgi:hypothetical protein